MVLNWNFLGGGGVQNKNLLWEEYGYFLELHNLEMWAFEERGKPEYPEKNLSEQG